MHRSAPTSLLLGLSLGLLLVSLNGGVALGGRPPRPELGRHHRQRPVGHRCGPLACPCTCPGAALLPCQLRQGTQACFNVTGTVGLNSCNGYQACYHVTPWAGSVGNNACDGIYACGCRCRYAATRLRRPPGLPQRHRQRGQQRLRRPRLYMLFRRRQRGPRLMQGRLGLPIQRRQRGPLRLQRRHRLLLRLRRRGRLRPQPARPGASAVLLDALDPGLLRHALGLRPVARPVGHGAVAHLPRRGHALVTFQFRLDGHDFGSRCCSTAMAWAHLALGSLPAAGHGLAGNYLGDGSFTASTPGASSSGCSGPRRRWTSRAVPAVPRPESASCCGRRSRRWHPARACPRAACSSSSTASPWPAPSAAWGSRRGGPARRPRRGWPHGQGALPGCAQLPARPQLPWTSSWSNPELSRAAGTAARATDVALRSRTSRRSRRGATPCASARAACASGVTMVRMTCLQAAWAEIDAAKVTDEYERQDDDPGDGCHLADKDPDTINNTMTRHATLK